LKESIVGVAVFGRDPGYDPKQDSVVVFAAIVLAGYKLHGPGILRRAASPRRSVAVLDFRNLTERPEAGWLANAIPEMISADLADGHEIRTIPGENVSRMETQLALHPAPSPARETLAAIRRDVGADIVVSGASPSV
jgi:hypothetical protein